ncbi:MAG: radical SAM protein [Planctomycetota bacterium]
MKPTGRFLDVRIDLTTGCNLRCVMCPISLFPRHHHFESLTPEQIKRVARAFFPRARTVSWSWATEPLLSPYLVDGVRVARAAGVRDVSMITNGVLLTPKRSRALLQVGLRRLVVSIDGARPETYAAIRDGAELERVLNHVSVFSAQGRNCSPRPTIEINMVLMRDNVEELAMLVEIAHRVGADQLNVIQPSIYERLDMESHRLDSVPAARIAAAIQEGERAARARRIRLMVSPLVEYKCGLASGGMRRLGWSLRQFRLKAKQEGLGAALRLAVFQVRYGGLRCPFPYFNIHIRGNGDIVPCCEWTFDEPLAHVDDDLESVLESEGWQGLRRSMESKSPLIESCRRCPVFSRRGGE